MLFSFLIAGLAAAGGIKGRVTDSNGKPRSGVTISIKGHRQTTTTDSNGYYTLNMPIEFDRKRVDVYVNGVYAVNCLVPGKDANSTVTVVLVPR